MKKAFLVARWQSIHLPVQETQLLSLSWEDPLEEEMTSRSNILAWGIPWTEEPGGSPWGLPNSRTRLSD